MPLVRRRAVALSLEYMTQVSAAVRAYDLRPFHAKSLVCMSRHSTGDVVVVCRPAAAGLELLICSVQRCVAARAGEDALLGVELVVLAGKGSFGALFAEDSELLCPSIRT